MKEVYILMFFSKFAKDHRDVDCSYGICRASSESNENEINIFQVFLRISLLLENAFENMIFIELPISTSILFMSDPSTSVVIIKALTWGVVT